MTGTYADVSALEQEIIAESLRRVPSVRPAVALVIAEALSADEQDLASLARLLGGCRTYLAAPRGSSERSGRTGMTKREPKELKLTERQLRYFEGRLEGKSKLQAALAAGYSRHSAINAAYNIEKRGRGGDPSIRKVLGFLERKQVSKILDFLDHQRGRNGVEAKSATEVQSDQ